MKRLILLAVLLLAACSGQQKPSAANQVFAAWNAYEAALIVAVRYNELPRCGRPSSPPLCSDAAIVAQVRTANGAARAALDAAEKTVRDPTLRDDVKLAAVEGATNAIAALQAILTLYVPKAK